MDYHLPPHISFGFVGARAVVLDAAADRYFLLDDRDAQTLASFGEAGVHSVFRSHADRLVGRGLVGRGGGAAIVPVIAPSLRASALESPGEMTAIPVWEVGRHRLAASLSLRFSGLAATIDRWRRARALWARQQRGMFQAGGEAAHDMAARLAKGHAEARLFIPARRRCVPDSLALIQCLWRRGVTADLFFGVRLAPFAAHCWVQADGLLLSDPLDIVAEFTPVFQL